jgi:hypothetical protein
MSRNSTGTRGLTVLSSGEGPPRKCMTRCYSDVTPADLQKKGLSFPLADYHTAMLESYEKWVQK